MQQNAPLVAIVTPVYNGGPYLRETCASVQAQTYPNLVHFVLDNASTDETPDIIEEFRGRRIPVVSVRNDTLLPLCDNWNRCVELGAKGAEYFRILCADDTMPPESIEKMVQLAERDPDILLVGSHCQSSIGPCHFGWPENQDIFQSREALRMFLQGKVGLAPTHLLWKTSVLSLRDHLFDCSTITCDTEAVLFTLSQENAKFGFVDDFLGFVRWYDESVSGTLTNRLHIDFFEWALYLDKYSRFAMPEALSASTIRRYWRHYLGRFLVWRFRHHNYDAVNWHRNALATARLSPTFVNFADAVFDFLLRKMKLRSSWQRHPQG